MKPEERQALLSDLERLESMLLANENKFYQNQSDYRNVVNGLREKYFELEGLEQKLSKVEAERLEEQRVFRQRLLIISGLLILFITMIVLLITFSNQLRKQKKQLLVANEEIKTINENLESIVLERTKLLADANQELDTFLYRASHDLRSPVRSIMGLCSLGAYLPPAELVQKVEKTTVGMDRLLQKLAMISEINHPSDLSSLAVFDLASRVAAKFDAVIKKERVEFYIDCDQEVTFYSYPHVVAIIIENLLENAMFYSVLRSADFARVELKASVIDGMLTISVYDNGIGISDEVRARLFDMFYKGNEMSTGNGLGLYIVQKSVQALSGDIQVESQLGHYSRFTVIIPVATELVREEIAEEIPV